MNRIRVFAASPGDVPQERDAVSIVVEELRRTVAPLIPVELETVRWETHAWPGAGKDAQDVINTQIGEYDVFVGIMWKRFGTRTKRAAAGTAEEFERAYDLFKRYGRPKIMFYFRGTPFFTTDLKEIGQFRRVILFRKALEKYGVLFWPYSDALDFERRFREHLTHQIGQLRSHKTGDSVSSPPRIFFSYMRADSERVERVYEALRAAGFSPWMDVRDILPGRQWIPEIKSAIESADFFITFVSQNTVGRGVNVKSETGFSVDNEIGYALTQFHDPKSYFIPVRLDPVNPPDSIAKFQWVDLFVPNGLPVLINGIQKVWEKNRANR